MLHLARLEQIFLFFAISLRPTIKIIRHNADQWAPCADQWALFIRSQIMIALFYFYFRLLHLSIWWYRLCFSHIVLRLETLSKGNL
jgi:hypothetical protein